MRVNHSEIMLYVKDVENSRRFWVERIGLTLIEKRVGPDNSDAYAINAGGTTFVLMDRAIVEKYSPEVSIGIPSILFCVDNIDNAHRQLVQANVKTTDIINMGGMRTFSFCDDEGNYYAVK